MDYSLQRLLVIYGLIIIPFYEIFLRALPFVRSVAPDSRAPKEIIALVFALSIGLLAVFQGTLKPFRNRFFIIIPIFLLFNLIIAPHVDLFINNVESGDFYFWKPFSEVLCFALMIFAVSSMKIDFNEIINVMVICGAVMAGYMILQKFELDQFWIAKTAQNFTAVRSHNIGGNLGQPTLAASFIVMMIPLAFYLEKYFLAILITIGVLITGSAMSIFSILAMVLAWVVRLEKFMIIPIGLVLIIGICIIKESPTIQSKIIERMDGRWPIWKETCDDIKHGAISGQQMNFSMTGVGFGRFSYLFPDKHKNTYFQQAHNDLLEITYDCGIVILFLILAGIYSMAIGNIFYDKNFFVFLSFLGILISSLGSFPFQLGAHQFYAAILVGFLHNEKLTGGLK